MSTQTHLPPKCSFSSDFGHFNLKILENAKMAYVTKILKYHNFGGTSPADFSTAGDPSPRPSVFDAHVFNAYFCAVVVVILL